MVRTSVELFDPLRFGNLNVQPTRGAIRCACPRLLNLAPSGLGACLAQDPGSTTTLPQSPLVVRAYQ